MKAKDSSIRGIVANGANIVRKTGYVSFVALGASIGLASKLIDQAYEATKDGYKASTTEPTQDNSDIEPWDSASESEPPTPSIDIDKELETFQETYATEITEHMNKFESSLSSTLSHENYGEYIYELYLQHKKGELGW